MEGQVSKTWNRAHKNETIIAGVTFDGTRYRASLWGAAGERAPGNEIAAATLEEAQRRADQLANEVDPHRCEESNCREWGEYHNPAASG